MDTRFSEYRIMWVLVLFDLPTDTKKDRKEMVIIQAKAALESTAFLRSKTCLNLLCFSVLYGIQLF